MIFISSSCIKKEFIIESVVALHKIGFSNIELSGGTKFYPGIIDDLLNLKEKYNLNYLCHNYFPPPQNDFVLNLSSQHASVFQQSYDHVVNALETCEILGVKKYAFHAGFFLDPHVNDLGNKFKLTHLNDVTQATNTFCMAYNKIIHYQSKVKIYIENNVLSEPNYNTYKKNPFMLTNLKDYVELKKKIDFNLLLDVAHLKVSCNTLNLDFALEFKKLINKTDYIHLSDNDGKHDSNMGIKQDSKVYNLLKNENLKGKTITLEIYEGPKSLINSYELLKKIT